MSPCPEPVDFLGFPVYPLRAADVLGLADQSIATRRPLLIGVVNAAKIVNMRRDERLRAAVLASDVILADGMSVVWAARLLGRDLPERVTGIDLMEHMLAHAHAQGYSLFLLGATPEVLEAVTDFIRNKYPQARVVGGHHGYFAPADEPRIVAAIRAARPDILFAAMSSPKKELFLARWYEEVDVPVCHGVGGAFDVLAGRVRRAPRFVQRLGLEWLYRLVQEPRRLWRRYLVTNTVFLGLLARELTRRRAGHAASL